MSINKVVLSYCRSAVMVALCGMVPMLVPQSVSAQESYGADTGTIREVKSVRVKLPFSELARPATVEVVDGIVVYEGDIVLGTETEVERAANIPVVVGKDRGGAATNAVSIDGSSLRWPFGIIPYQIADGHPLKSSIEAAVRMVQDRTIMCMPTRTIQVDYVRFVNGSGCSSSVGKRGGVQTITIGSCSTGSIVHEILHAAGLFHEQSREDRNNFVTINLGNVEAGKEHNFDRHVSDATDFATYDYGSIMHYGPTAFSKNGMNTITVKTRPGLSPPAIGQRTAPSLFDINAIRSLYQNSGGCSK